MPHHSIDFASKAHFPTTLKAVYLFALALLFALPAWSVYLNTQIQAQKIRLSDLNLKTQSPLPVEDPAPAAQWQRAQQHLNLPWAKLFAQVERASHEKITLLSIEPDARLGVVRLTGLTENHETLEQYIERLGETGFLTQLEIESFNKTDSSPHPLRFAVTARWLAQGVSP